MTGRTKGYLSDPIDWLGPLPEEQSRFRHRGLTPHWQANTVLSGGHRTDVIELNPASMKTVTMRPDNPGTCMYHCHVNDHIDAGMIRPLHRGQAAERAERGGSRLR